MLDEARHSVDEVVNGEVADASVASWWCFLLLERLPLDQARLGFLWGASAHNNLRVLWHQPHLSLLYGVAPRGPPPMSLGWTPPIWGQVGVGLSRWIEPLEIDSNISPLDLILYVKLKLYLLVSMSL